jgi:hypothetical protein
MPIMDCTKDKKPGFKYGDAGECYTYNPEDERSKTMARAMARKQGQAIEHSKGNWK